MSIMQMLKDVAKDTSSSSTGSTTKTAGSTTSGGASTSSPTTTTTANSKAKEKKRKSFLEVLKEIEEEEAAKKAKTVSPIGVSFQDAFPWKAPTVSQSPQKAESTKQAEKSVTNNAGWFRKGLLEDGYDFGDVTKTILGTAADALEDLGAGIAEMPEKIIDAGATLAPYYRKAQLYQQAYGGNLDAPVVKVDQELQKMAHEFDMEQAKKETDEFIKKDLYDGKAVAHSLLNPVTDAASAIIGQDYEYASVLGDKADATVQSGGQMLATAGLQAVGVPWFLTTYATSYGAEAENALNEGATHEEAMGSAAIAAAAEVLTEKISGGIKFGGKALDDALTQQIARGISNKLGRTVARLGVDFAGEAGEELLSEIAGNLGSALYRLDEESWKEILWSEEAMQGYLDAMIGGGLMGSVSGGYKAIDSTRKGVDYVSGLTKNEQTVVDKVYKERLAEEQKKGKVTQKQKDALYERVLSDMDKGYITTDEIESALGGGTYTLYKNTVDSEDAILKEYEELGQKTNATLKDQARYTELTQQVKDIREKSQRDALKSQLGQEVAELVKGDRLAESYNERARRGQAFQADIKKYDARQQAVIQKAIDSGILNNTNRTHEFVDLVSKISADKGVLFDFTNNQKLKDTGFAVEGKQVNGYVTKDGITLNIDSRKTLETTVGHEITHVLEGTEVYDTLKQTIFDYAKAKGDYQGRFDSLTELYKDVKDADIEGELTADLVGDYLFSDTDFIKNLSTQNRNVFQKVYDEIKYLCKVVTAGSKEARELEKVKKAFEDAYRAEMQKNSTDGGVKYKISDMEIDRKYIDYADAKSSNMAIDEKVADLVNRGKSVELPTDRISNYETSTDWTDKKAVRDLLKGILKPFMGVDVQFEHNGKTATAYLTKTGVNHSVGGNASPRKATAFEKFNALVKNAEYAFSSNNDSHSKSEQNIDGNIDWDTFVAVGTVNGEPYPILFKIRSIDSDVRSQIYEMATKKETGFSHGDGSEENQTDAHPNYGTSPISEERLAQNPDNVKYSLSDSDGRQLTKEQQEYFKDSKMRDENGNLKVMYHGTPNGNFTVFRDGTYFTDSKEYADRYQNPGASSISTGKEAKNPKTFEVYLDIKKPFDINDAEARDIYINEYIKGGNAMGINPYLSDAEYAKINTIDWTEGEDLRDFLIDNGYDYDGLVLDEGGTGGYGDEVQSRGKSYVVFSPEQVKNVDNLKPTVDPDIRYSLSSMDEAPVRPNYRATMGYDIALQDIAPTAEDSSTVAKPDTISETETIAPLPETARHGVSDDIGPVKPSANDSGNKPVTRKELHSGIIDRVKTTFSDKGFDFDKVLKNAKNLSTWATVDNTPQRVMEKTFGYKEGGILADITVNKVAQDESEGIRWVNKNVKMLKDISKQYHIKPGSKESAAAQMYAEGFFVNENNEIVRYGDPELIQDFKDPEVRRNIKALAGDPRIRKIYDDTLASINAARARNLYPEIPRLDNYFLHFRAMNDTFSTLGLPFNPNDIRAKDLPTDLNGVTADLKPGQPFFASAMHRKGKRTSFDMLGGIERYLNSAKDQIYHIDNIQTLRALRNYIAETYGQATGLENIDSMTDAEAEERINQVYGSHLSTFAKFLNEEANVLAGKTALIDRGAEGIFGRRAITFMKTLSGQVGSNQVGYNISSSLTNFLPVAQTFANTNKFDFVKAFAQTVANKFSGGKFDSFAEDSPVVIRRKGSDRFYQTPWQKMQNPGYILMSAVDGISTELIARTKYNEFIRKGMDSQKAHFETDKWVSKLMGDRSLGQMPHVFNSSVLGLLTKYQLEVRNYLDSAFYDTIQEEKVSNEHIQNELARNTVTAAKIAARFTETAVAMHLFGKAFESVAGYNPAFDIIEVLMTAFGHDDDEESEDTVLDNLGQALMELAEDMPYASILLDGGRVPVSEAIPDLGPVMRGEDEYGNKIGIGKAFLEEAKDIAPYYLMPGGYGQLKKTVAGLEMYDLSEDHPIAGSYTDKGNLRFPVDIGPVNIAQAAVFGQYANENARQYFDEEQQTLNPEQTKIFAAMGIPIQDYWEYRDKYNDFKEFRNQLWETASTEEATAEDVVKNQYVNSIYYELNDLYDLQKELADSSLADRQSQMRKIQDQMNHLLKTVEAVNDPSVDGIYAKVGDRRYNYSEEKDTWYEITGSYLEGEQNAIKRYNTTPEHYWNNRELYKQANEYFKYNWDLQTVAKNVFKDGSFVNYAAELSQIKGEDLDGDGKSDSGTKKKKVFAYIDTLDASEIAKKILRKMSYPSEDTYNMEIIEYLNRRSDLSYADKKETLEALGFAVDSKGNITWK